MKKVGIEEEIEHRRKMRGIEHRRIMRGESSASGRRTCRANRKGEGEDEKSKENIGFLSLN